MNGLSINSITLELTRLPGRKGLAFCFVEGGSLYPVAYVSQKLEGVAIAKWQKMLGDEK